MGAAEMRGVLLGGKSEVKVEQSPQVFGNHDLLPMMMMTQDQFFKNGSQERNRQDGEAVSELPAGIRHIDHQPMSMTEAVNDEGIFHYENHESLEDEVFELHTNNKDADNDADGGIFASRQAVDISTQVNEPCILFGDRSSCHHKLTSSAKQLPEAT